MSTAPGINCMTTEPIDASPTHLQWRTVGVAKFDVRSDLRHHLRRGQCELESMDGRGRIDIQLPTGEERITHVVDQGSSKLAQQLS